MSKTTDFVIETQQNTIDFGAARARQMSKYASLAEKVIEKHSRQDLAEYYSQFGRLYDEDTD